MIRKIALLATAGVLAASVASAQTPPPGNVNPGSTKSGAEQTGAPNQPRSQNGGYAEWRRDEGHHRRRTAHAGRHEWPGDPRRHQRDGEARFAGIGFGARR